MYIFFLVDFPKKQLKYLKDNLKRCLDKRNKETRSGASYTNLPNGKYCDQLALLHDKISSHQAESNVTLESSPLESTFQPECAITESLPKESHAKRKDDEPLYGKGERAKQELGSAVDAMLFSHIKEMSKNEIKDKESSNNEDADSLFCRSCVATLKRLPPKKNSKAKSRSQELLYNIEFSE